MEVAQELAVAFQNVAAAYQTAQSYFNRRIATERELRLYEYQYEAGTTTLAFVLTAQSSLASAEQSYYQSLTAYAQAIMDLNYRKGTLLDFHNVTLAESGWTPEAYRDAVRDAWARAHAIPADAVQHSEPEVIQLPQPAGAGAPAAPPEGSATFEVAPAPAPGTASPAPGSTAPAPGASSPALVPTPAPPAAPANVPPIGLPASPSGSFDPETGRPLPRPVIGPEIAPDTPPAHQ